MAKAHDTKSADDTNDTKTTHATKGTHDTKGAHDTKSAGDATPAKGEVADELHTLTTALKGDLTKLAPKADKTLAHWEGLVEKVGAKPIAADLGKLREHLGKPEIDGAAVAKLLHGLSTKTAKVAEDTGGVVGTALKSLAGALEKGAASLTDEKASAK